MGRIDVLFNCFGIHLAGLVPSFFPSLFQVYTHAPFREVKVRLGVTDEVDL